MGYSNWSDTAYARLSSARSGAARSTIFTNTGRVDPAMNPHGLTVRESRDSAAHPDSNPIIVAFDVTGSMGRIPEQFARDKLGGLMRMLVERDFVVDPQVLFAAIGDAYTDRGPLQLGQFESGLEMDMWLTRIWLESGGGGQRRESYGLAHWFAARHTSTDCFEKRGKKGYLFTMGDELPWDLPAEHVKAVFGYDPERDFTIEEVVREAGERFEVFHVVVTEGHHGRDPEVLARWRELLGHRALVLPDSGGVCELVGAAIGVLEGSLASDRLANELAALGVTPDTADAIVEAVSPLAPAAAPPRPTRAAAAPPPGDDHVLRL